MIQRQRIVEAHEDGLSASEIGRRFGITRQRVHQILNGEGLTGERKFFIRNPNIVLEYIVRYKSQNDGVAPSLREIGTACKISSTSVVYSILRKLAEDGAIIVNEGPRNIRVPGGHWEVRG